MITLEIFRNISKIGLLENISDRLREIKETLESIQNILPTTTSTTTTTKTRPTRTSTTRLRVWNFSLFKLKTFSFWIEDFESSKGQLEPLGRRYPLKTLDPFKILLTRFSKNSTGQSMCRKPVLFGTKYGPLDFHFQFRPQNKCALPDLY